MDGQTTGQINMTDYFDLFVTHTGQKAAQSMQAK